MTTYVPALIWVFAGVVCLLIAKRLSYKASS